MVAEIAFFLCTPLRRGALRANCGPRLFCGNRGKSCRHDSVFCFEEMLEVVGECGGKFLPCEEFEAGGEGWAVHGGEDCVPGFDEVVTASVGEDAEGCVGSVGREDVADELIAFDD